MTINQNWDKESKKLLLVLSVALILALKPPT